MNYKALNQALWTTFELEINFHSTYLTIQLHKHKNRVACRFRDHNLLDIWASNKDVTYQFDVEPLA